MQQGQNTLRIAQGLSKNNIIPQIQVIVVEKMTRKQSRTKTPPNKGRGSRFNRPISVAEKLNALFIHTG
jgi:hypothetical protein